MKSFNSFLLVALVVISGCASKKTETTAATTDSLAVDSLMMNPGPSLLAFSPISGFSLDNKLVLSDSVNYFLFTNQEELDKKFVMDKSGEGVTPDFLINHVVAVACAPTMARTSITIDRVENSSGFINVYLTIFWGEKQQVQTKPSQIFVIEKREGSRDMQFFVNGKQDKSLFLM